MQKQMPYTPAQIPNKVSFYRKDNNIKGDTQEDIVQGSIQKIYLNYLKGLKGYSKAKTGLYKPIKDHNKAKIDLP